MPRRHHLNRVCLRSPASALQKIPSAKKAKCCCTVFSARLFSFDDWLKKTVWKPSPMQFFPYNVFYFFVASFDPFHRSSPFLLQTGRKRKGVWELPLHCVHREKNCCGARNFDYLSFFFIFQTVSTPFCIKDKKTITQIFAVKKSECN